MAKEKRPEEAAWEMTAEQEKADRASYKADRAKSPQERYPEINMAKPTSKLPTPAGGPVTSTIGIRG